MGSSHHLINFDRTCNIMSYLFLLRNKMIIFIVNIFILSRNQVFFLLIIFILSRNQVFFRVISSQLSHQMEGKKQIWLKIRYAAARSNTKAFFNLSPPKYPKLAP